MQPPILIHGPTASGKTALAIAVARHYGGEVINADSMQVYSGLRALTARPSEAEMEGVPHHLFGHIDPAERYSTGRWLADVAGVYKDVVARGKVPIFVGGTGLYLLGLIEGLSDVPPIPDDVRADVLALLSLEGPEVLHKRLLAVDGATAERLAPRDRQRVSRAYEVWLATGKALSAFQTERAPALLGETGWLGIALTPPRARLYARIDRRFEGMLMEGAMAEARELVARKLDPELPVMKAHGMPWLKAFIDGEMSAEKAAEFAKRDTRRYAKRQFTWIGRQFPFWPRIPTESLNARTKVIFALYREIDAEDWVGYASK